jgi:hypothetical protein
MESNPMGAISHMEQQPQRRTPRFPFSASAEVTRLDTGATESTKVNELSLYGCYLDTRAPLPRGAKVNIRIHSGGQFFEAPASVVYSQPTLGMGLAFRDVKPVFLGVLQKWLRQGVSQTECSATCYRRL